MIKIQNPIAATENCRYCLMCRHTCPVGHVTGRETLTPHGWGLTIASVKRDLLQWNEDTVDVLYSCADCGTCRAHCVTDQPLPTAIAAARAEVVEQGLAPAAVSKVHDTLKQWSNPYKEQAPRPAEGHGEVALFIGDDAPYVWPSLLEAVVTLLRAVDVEPVLVGYGRNNGYLASSLGFPQTAEALAQANLDELRASGAGRLLVLTPGDYYVFGQMYQERLGIPWPEECELVEVVSFLEGELQADRLKVSPAANGGPYAYVDPTHTVRVAGRYTAPRKLLAAAMPEVSTELFWRQERTHPCGNTALQFTQPHISNHLTYARLDDAVRQGAVRVVTEDPGCLAHLDRHAARFGLQVQGLYELLADCLVSE